MMGETIYDKALPNQQERENDPFYSEENWEAMIKAKEQLERGEGIITWNI